MRHYRWMDGWMDEWMDGRMEKWREEGTYRQTDGRTDGYGDGSMGDEGKEGKRKKYIPSVRFLVPALILM